MCGGPPDEQLENLRRAVLDAFAGPAADPPPPRRSGLRRSLALRRSATPADRAADEQFENVRQAALAVFSAQSAERRAAIAQYEASNMATMLRESRAAIRAHGGELDCVFAVTRRGGSGEDTLACRRDQ
jgi:hypothetical protein